MHVTRLLKLAAMAVFSLGFSTLIAGATEAVTVVDLNVRTGPGTQYRIVDTLRRGERVDTVECTTTGWCFVKKDGPDGWVSSRYLTTPPGTSSSRGGGSDCYFKITIGTGGKPNLEIVCDGPTRPSPVSPFPVIPDPDVYPDPPRDTRACFYTKPDYRGSRMCMGAGSKRFLGNEMNDAISSIQVFRNATVTLCEHPDFGGRCYEFTENIRRLSSSIDNRASSLSVNRDVTVPVNRDKACFYTGRNYTGQSFCMESGGKTMLDNRFNDAITSVRIYGNARARLCQHPNYQGFCRVVQRSESQLGGYLNNQVTSIEMVSGNGGGTARPAPSPTPRPGPAVRGEGAFGLSNGSTFDLDTGTHGGQGADLWLVGNGANSLELVPRENVRFARNAAPREGAAGCIAVDYDQKPIPVSQLNTGRRFCVKTSRGNVAELRVQENGGGTLVLSYKLWDTNLY